MTERTLKRKFRQRLHELVRESGLSWTALSEEIGLSYGTLQGMLIRKKYLPNPKMTVLVKLSTYFGVTVQWLITGEE